MMSRYAHTLALAALLTACGGGDGASPPVPASPSAEATPGEDSVGPEDVTTGVDDRWIDAARADLAERTGVDPAGIVVVGGGLVDWNDSSLGCPEPGMSYLQTITPGYRLVLAADGERHHYHGARDRPPALCEDPAGGGYQQSSDV
jgi:hypothetical protein